MNGQTLIERRQRGLCIDCGHNTPRVDPSSGYGYELLCDGCRKRRKQERDQRVEQET